jgi:hypothetical protein
MTDDAVTGRLERAEGIPDLLEAAYGAFEYILETARLAGSHAGGAALLSAFTLAAAAAASGRDAIAAAQSLPPPTELPPLEPAEGPDGDVADHLAALARMLRDRLTTAPAATASDRAGCADGATQAGRIHELLAGPGL